MTPSPPPTLAALLREMREYSYDAGEYDARGPERKASFAHKKTDAAESALVAYVEGLERENKRLREDLAFSRETVALATQTLKSGLETREAAANANAFLASLDRAQKAAGYEG